MVKEASEPKKEPDQKKQEVATTSPQGKNVVVTDNTPLGRVKQLIKSEDVQKRFKDVLGKKAQQFMASIVNLVAGNTYLQKCEPTSIMASAMIAAALDLPIDPNLGFAYIIPYGSKAQFQMGYKGFIQLAMRTGQYKTINVCKVFEGELIRENRMTGEYELDYDKKKSDKVEGYIAYFRLLNGYEKAIYRSLTDIHAHARRFSQSYNRESSAWKTATEEMEAKTVLKALISKWGILSIEMQKAIADDQTVDGEYEDNPTRKRGEVIDLDAMKAGEEGHTPVDQPLTAAENAALDQEIARQSAAQ